MKNINIPNITCEGYRDEWDRDFDCLYEKAPDCGDCIINYHKTGGRIDPTTGKKIKYKRIIDNPELTGC